MDVRSISTHCARTEFVGTTVLDTIGLVISGIDPQLLKEMNIGTRYHALGLLSSRTGAAGQITAVDDAVKATSTEVLSIDLPRDTKGWGGHGNYIVLGGNDVSDVRQAIEIALERTEDTLQALGEHKRPGQFLCGFSMETEHMIENSVKKLEKKNLDMIVANNVKVEGAGFGTDTNVVTILTRNGQVELPKMSKDQVAERILDEILSMTDR